MNASPEQERRDAFCRRLEAILFRRYAGEEEPPPHAYAMQEQCKEVYAAFEKECVKVQEELEFAHHKKTEVATSLGAHFDAMKAMVHKALFTDEAINIVDERYPFSDTLYEISNKIAAATDKDYQGFTTEHDAKGNLQVTGREDAKGSIQAADSKPALTRFNQLLGELNDAIVAADYYYVPKIDTVIDTDHLCRPGEGERLFYQTMKRYAEVYKELKLGETVETPEGPREKEMRDLCPDAKDGVGNLLYPPPLTTSLKEILESRRFDELDKMHQIEKINRIPVPARHDLEHGPFEKAMHGWHCWVGNQTKGVSDEKRFGMPGYDMHKDMTRPEFLKNMKYMVGNGHEWLATMRKVSHVLENTTREDDRKLAAFITRFANSLEAVYTEARKQRQLAGISPELSEPPYPDAHGRLTRR